MGRTVRRKGSRTTRPSQRPDTSEGEGLWGPLPPERYDFRTRALYWLLALAILVFLSILLYGV